MKKRILLNFSAENVVKRAANADDDASIFQDFLRIFNRVEIIRIALYHVVMIMQSDAVQFQFVGLLYGYIGEGQHDFGEANGPYADVGGVKLEVADSCLVVTEGVGRELFCKRYTDGIGTIMRLRNQSYGLEFGRALNDEFDGVGEGV